MMFYRFHPYTSFAGDTKYFKDANGETGNSTRLGPDMSDDASELWRLGKNAFDALPKTESIEQFDIRYKEHLAGIKILAGVLEEAGNKIFFTNDDGESCTPDFSKARSSQILDVYWQLSQKNALEFLDYPYHFLYACLEEIDNALLGVCFDGAAVYSVIAAVNALGNFQAIESGNDSLQKARSDLALRGAIERHRRDPKQIEKEFVFDCWTAWKIKPEQYKSKAEFSRAMLDKCEHLTSQKNIEDWCREWDAKTKNVPLPAQ